MIIEIQTHEELAVYVKEWCSGEIDHLYIMGVAGSGKTRTVHRAIREAQKPYEFRSGHMTPKAFYSRLREWENMGTDLLVLDDIQAVYESNAFAGLLKQAMDGSDTRRVFYDSTQKTGSDKPFTDVNFRFCIILNDMGTRNAHIEAIQSRCYTLMFAPTWQMNLNFALELGLVDKDLVSEINRVGGTSSGYISLRDLKKLQELKSKGRDWLVIYEGLRNTY